LYHIFHKSWCHLDNKIRYKMKLLVLWYRFDFPNKFGVFTRLDAWVSWPAKRAIDDNRSPPHHPCITYLGKNKSTLALVASISFHLDLICGWPWPSYRFCWTSIHLSVSTIYIMCTGRRLSNPAHIQPVMSWLFFILMTM
jgi:hypothetical protein